MSRQLTTAFSDALGDPNVKPILIFEAEFASGTVRLWTGFGDLSWNGQTWTGGGNLLGVAPMEEVSGVVAAGATVSLSGVPANLISIAINEARQGLPGRAWFGLLNDAGQVIADPAQMFVGRLDVPSIEADGATVVISITYENRLIDMDRPREFRYTDQSQRAIFPNDAGFNFVTSLQEAEIVWGRQ
jgi:hypothetical protein